MATRTTSPAGLALIRGFESFAARQYICPAGKPTIGYGHVVLAGETFAEPIDRDQANALLSRDLGAVEVYLSAVFPDLPQHQFDALASFCFNVGLGAFEGSTLFKLLKAGRIQEAADQFPRWVHGGGRVLPGLVRRRAAERAMFLGASA